VCCCRRGHKFMTRYKCITQGHICSTNKVNVQTIRKEQNFGSTLAGPCSERVAVVAFPRIPLPTLFIATSPYSFFRETYLRMDRYDSFFLFLSLLVFLFTFLFVVVFYFFIFLLFIFSSFLSFKLFFHFYLFCLLWNFLLLISFSTFLSFFIFALLLDYFSFPFLSFPFFFHL
jgi:hypothetical protein